MNAKGYLPILLTHHLVEFFLFLARFVPFLAFYIARYVAWMESAPKVVIGESGSILRTDCRVSISAPLTYSSLINHFRNTNLSPLHWHSVGQFAQHTTEWAIPYERTRECLRHLRKWLENEPYTTDGTYPHFPIELRFSAPDDIWLSPAYGRRTCWIGIIQFKCVLTLLLTSVVPAAR